MGRRSAVAARRAHLDHVAEHLGAELGEEQLGQRAGGDAGRGLPGAGPLEHVAGVVEAVLLHADEVGVAGPGLVSGFSVTPGAGDISSCHFGHSVLWITIETGEPSVRPWRTPPRSSTSSRSKRMRGPAAEAEAAAGELVADLRRR